MSRARAQVTTRGGRGSPARAKPAARRRPPAKTGGGFRRACRCPKGWRGACATGRRPDRRRRRDRRAGRDGRAADDGHGHRAWARPDGLRRPQYPAHRPQAGRSRHRLPDRVRSAWPGYAFGRSHAAARAIASARLDRGCARLTPPARYAGDRPGRARASGGAPAQPAALSDRRQGPCPLRGRSAHDARLASARDRRRGRGAYRRSFTR